MRTHVYDLIGDIHGHADELVKLLSHLGYQNSKKTSYRLFFLKLIQSCNNIKFFLENLKTLTDLTFLVGNLNPGSRTKSGSLNIMEILGNPLKI